MIVSEITSSFLCLSNIVYLLSPSPPLHTLSIYSAGVGRTGTFIAIDRLIFQIERENTVDVYGIVHDLRMHRPLMVQTEVGHYHIHSFVVVHAF